MYKAQNIDTDKALKALDLSEQQSRTVYICQFPAADVAPVKHGRWRQVDEIKCECSNCGIIVLIAVYPHGDKNYCPNCGAKMDGGDPNAQM